MSISLLTSALQQNRQTWTEQSLSTKNIDSIQEPEMNLCPLKTFLRNASLRVNQISHSLTDPIIVQMHHRSSNISRYMSEGLILKNELQKIKAALKEIIMSPQLKQHLQIVPIILDEKLEPTIAPSPDVDDAEEIHRLTEEIDLLLEETYFNEPIDLKEALIRAEKVFKTQMNLLDSLSIKSCDEPSEEIQDKITRACIITADDIESINSDAGEYYRDNIYEFDRINYGKGYYNTCRKIVKTSSSVLQLAKTLIDSIPDQAKMQSSSEHLESYKIAYDMNSKLSITLRNIKENPKIQIRPMATSLDSLNCDVTRSRSSSRGSLARSYSPIPSFFTFDDDECVNQDSFIEANIYMHGKISEEGHFEIRGNGPQMSPWSSNIAFDKNILNHSIVQFPKADEKEYEFFVVFVCDNGEVIESKTGLLSYKAVLEGELTIEF